jgi:predicted TIM-barrel fold metal-dependent hydrolase
MTSGSTRFGRWTAKTAAHTLRIVFGVFTRHPNLKLLLAHMGETLPYLLWRLYRRAQAFSAGETVGAQPGHPRQHRDHHSRNVLRRRSI